MPCTAARAREPAVEVPSAVSAAKSRAVCDGSDAMGPFMTL